MPGVDIDQQALAYTQQAWMRFIDANGQGFSANLSSMHKTGMNAFNAVAPDLATVANRLEKPLDLAM